MIIDARRDSRLASPNCTGDHWQVTALTPESLSRSVYHGFTMQRCKPCIMFILIPERCSSLSSDSVDSDSVSSDRIRLPSMGHGPCENWNKTLTGDCALFSLLNNATCKKVETVPTWNRRPIIVICYSTLVPYNVHQIWRSSILESWKLRLDTVS